MAVASVVLAIISIVVALIGYFAFKAVTWPLWVALIAGIVGVILAVAANQEDDAADKHTVILWGLILSIIAVVLAIIFFLI